MRKSYKNILGVTVLAIGVMCAPSHAISDKERDRLDFAENLVVSIGSFSIINAVLLREYLQNGGASLLIVPAISVIEVAKNLINYVDIEMESQILGPISFYFAFNALRTGMPVQQPRSSFWFFLEGAIAEVLKNRINFEVTENWYPKRWLKQK